MTRMGGSMGFGLSDSSWLEPDDEEPLKCHDCEFWNECPCGCGHGWCSMNSEFTEGDDGCDT